MVVYDMRSRYGWLDDNGIGEKLIEEIKKGKKKATCSFKDLSDYEDQVGIYSTKGKKVTVENYKGEPKCNIKVLDVFETDFYNPDMKLIEGEGYGKNIKQFQDDHIDVYKSITGLDSIPNDLKLTVEIFELID